MVGEASFWRIAHVLLLVMAANGGPVLLARALPLGQRWPVDGGRQLRDGRRLFGSSKTWQGIAAAVVGAVIMALVLGYGWLLGVAVGLAAMAGDLISSFIKRRMGVPASGQVPMIDQVPEALLPALVAALWLPLTTVEVLLAVLLFFAIEPPLSRALFHLGVRRRPY